MAVTIKDIARVAGVSHSTVSRALRDHPGVAPTTIVRIKKIAAEMGYVPSAVARGLKTRRSQALGVIVSRIDDPFFSEILQSIDDVLRSSGYSMFVAASDRSFERERTIVRAMGERRVDGLIVCSTYVSAEHHRQLRRYGVPIVVVDNQAAEDFEYSIYHDDQYGSFCVTQHLIELGHSRIAYLGNALAGRTTLHRLAGYRNALQAAGLPVRDELLLQAPDGQPEGGAVSAHRLLALPHLPTAVVCFNDLIALGLMPELVAHGITVPAGCSVTGFDNIEISAFLNPPLTTFHQPKYELGHEAAGIMLKLLGSGAGQVDGDRPPIRILRGKLLVRDSTGPPPR